MANFPAVPDVPTKVGAQWRALVKRERAALLERATALYGAPVRLIEAHGVLELRAGGHLMCAAYSMRGRAVHMLLALLKSAVHAEVHGLNLHERDGTAAP